MRAALLCLLLTGCVHVSTVDYVVVDASGARVTLCPSLEVMP